MKPVKHYHPQQRRRDGRWEYTVDDGRLSYAVGYCIGLPDLSDPDLVESLGGYDSPAYVYYAKEVNKFREKYHNDGHGTAEHAYSCYRNYLLDNRTDLNRRLSEPSLCEVCDRLTWRAAVVNNAIFDLCDEHRTKQHLISKMAGTLVLDTWEM